MWGSANWDLLPEHMHSGVRLYVEEGIAPGTFMCAVIQNDLKGALGHADITNRECLFEIVQFFYNYVPANAWGSKKVMRDWMKHNGLKGSGD